MKLTLTIDTENAAFDDEDCGPELARILRALADDFNEPTERYKLHGYAATVMDANGNRCGAVSIA